VRVRGMVLLGAVVSATTVWSRHLAPNCFGTKHFDSELFWRQFRDWQAYNENRWKHG